jgi:hypothetical protein
VLPQGPELGGVSQVGVARDGSVDEDGHPAPRVAGEGSIARRCAGGRWRLGNQDARVVVDELGRAWQKTDGRTVGRSGSVPNSVSRCDSGGRQTCRIGPRQACTDREPLAVPRGPVPRRDVRLRGRSTGTAARRARRAAAPDPGEFFPVPAAADRPGIAPPVPSPRSVADRRWRWWAGRRLIRPRGAPDPDRPVQGASVTRPICSAPSPG